MTSYETLYIAEVRHIRKDTGEASNWMPWTHGRIYNCFIVDNAIENLNRDYNQGLNGQRSFKWEFRKVKIAVQYETDL